MLKRNLAGLGGTSFTMVTTQAATELAGMHPAQTTGVAGVAMGNSMQHALVRQLLGGSVLEIIQSADRPLFLSQ